MINKSLSSDLNPWKIKVSSSSQKDKNKKNVKTIRIIYNSTNVSIIPSNFYGELSLR